MTLSKRAVDKPTTVLILFVILSALGIYSSLQLPIDLLPDMELPYIAVSTTYTNAGPEEVERSVTRILESAVSSVSGLKNMISTSSSGSSLVLLELNYGTNLDTATNEIRDKLDLVKGMLPDDAGSPMILKMDPSMMPVMQYVVTGNRTPEELRQYSEDIIQPRLEQVDGVASASISGGREKAIIIDIPRDRLAAYSLTITSIAQMIAAQNVEGSGGSISENDTTYSITTSGEYTSLDDIRNTVVAYKTTAGNYGTTAIPSVQKILLRDIADVYEGYKSVSSLAYRNGTPCVILSIQKQSGKNSVQTARQVRKQVESIQPLLPVDVTLTEEWNTTDIIETSINNIISAVLQGAFLAIVVLFIFLRSLKSTIIIGITIPVSLVITLGLMKFAGFSLNMMTLAGLSLGVGMLVDNSIVILENIYSYRAKGAKPVVAAVLGSQEMIMAITASTLTTICVFLPLVMYNNELGMIGQIFSGLTFTVVFSLVCSLAVAVVLVPVLASKYLKLENIAGRNRTGFLGTIDRSVTRLFDRIDSGYGRAVRWVLHHKLLIIAVIFVLLVASLMMIPVIGFIYMPEQGSNSVSVSLEMPKGTRLETTDEIIRQLETLVLRDVKGIKSSTVSVGGNSMMGLGGSSSNTASLSINLYPSDERQEGWDSDETARNKIRRYFTMFPGAVFSFGSSSTSMGGSDIDIVLKSNSMEQLQAAASDISLALSDYAGDVLTEVSSSMEDGLPQIDIVIDRNKMQDLGLTIYNVSNEIKANVNGTTASRYRDGGNEIDIVVQLPEEDRSRLLDLEQIFVLNSAGQRIPLANFASYEQGESPVSISRENQMRTMHVTAKKQNWRQATTEVQTLVDKIIREQVVLGDDVRISYGGSFESLQEGLTQFAIIILMAVILVFAVMASQFESFLDPFIVLFTIPLSIIGIVAMYLMSGSPLNMITAVGALVLVGIVVNNGIVLVDYTNLLRKRGYGLEDACVEAARNRLRPILMTTLTTVLGLVPMAFFPGDGSEMTQPIGQTVLGGLTFSTTMTLFLMPTLYYIFNRFREKRATKKTAKKQLRQERRNARNAKKHPISAVTGPDAESISGHGDSGISSYGMEDIDE